MSDSATDPGRVAGEVLTDLVVAPGEPWSGLVRAGEHLRIVDLEGCQAVDFLCYNADDPAERYCAADTMKIAGSIFLSRGVTLYSNLARPLFHLVEDTCGYHDTIGGCCSRESNAVRYGAHDTANCRDNFLRALEPHGLGRKDIVANINLFMYVPVEPDGAMAIVDGRSRPGDYVDMRAGMDVLAVLSNCPQMHNPANAYNLTPIRVIVWQPGG